MHINLTDAYQPGISRVHRMDARLKLILAVTLIILIGLTPIGCFAVYLGFFGLAMLGAWVARLNAGAVIRRSFIALPFMLAAVTLLFTIPGPTLVALPITGWTISEPGLIRFASILLKSLISVQFAILLILTTQLTDTLWALGALHTPKILVAIISFMYRYIFLLADESLRMTRARESRSAVIGGNPSFGRGVIFRAKTTGGMIGSLLLRSFERSERIYQAMIARGYQGQMRQFAPPRITSADWLFFYSTLLLGVALLAAGVLF